MGIHFSPDPCEWRRLAEIGHQKRKRNLPYRLAGCALLIGSFGTTFLHRALTASAPLRQGMVLEAALVLITMTFAAAGILLMLHGAKLFQDDRRGLGKIHDAQRIARRRKEPFNPIFDPADFKSGRVALASYLVYRAQAEAARRHRN